MSKAEERALEVYPIESHEMYDDLYRQRNAYVKGYYQAEKDNELTWEDIEKVCLIAKEVHLFRGFWSENVYQEVLERFLKERKEK